MLPKVAIIVLNYNGQDCLLDCLSSLDALSYPNKEIIVVDNDSTDDSLAEAQRRFPSFVYLSNKKNLGFAGGMNIGIREALHREADWVWLFNYDAAADKDALSNLIGQSLAYPRAGLLSPLILDRTSRIWFGKGHMNFFRMRSEHIPPSRKELSSPAYPSEFLTGCALLIKKEVFEKIDLLDERFFLYYEDADFSLRAKAARFETLVIPSAHVLHSEKSRSNPKKTYHLVLSGLFFFQKHASPLFRPYLFLYVTIRKIKNRIDMLRGRAGAKRVHQAYMDFYGNTSSHFDRHR